MCNCDDCNCKASFQDLEQNVIEWALVKGLLCPENSQKQLLKCMSELGELADGEISKDYAEIVDGIGDVVVTLIIYTKQNGLSLTECLNVAYMEIKDRTGKTVDGVFIKEVE